jgi:putative SOS response-associated peptidase YedK
VREVSGCPVHFAGPADDAGLCRYALHLRAGEVRAQVESQTGRHVGAWEDESDYNPDRGYNIPPRSRNPVILRGGGGAGDIYDESSTGEQKNEQTESTSLHKAVSNDLRIECMQWGLVPHWMKRQPDHASSLKTINARDDTIVYVSCCYASSDEELTG